MKFAFPVIVIFFALIFPMCNGTGTELQCVSCKSSPEKPNIPCEKGMGQLKTCSFEFRNSSGKVGKKKRRPPKAYLCAKTIIQKETIYGTYYLRNCIGEKVATSYCTRNIAGGKYVHCSTCTTEACNYSPRIQFSIVTLVSGTVLFKII